jgi:NAD(P)-dependent dehydrogenase (short-subunit alcohol dehydrogenase family)
MTQTLDNKAVLVTGAGRGLGAAIARRLAAAGARVAVADLQPQLADECAQAIDPSGERAWPLVLDVADLGSARSAVEAVCRRFGGLDVLVNNAGTDVTASIDELSFEAWDRVLATNLKGPFLMSKLALAALRASEGGQGGHIVNIASTAARRTWPNASAYHASKWGLVGLSHALHAELRPQGVRVSTVIAGGMRTPFLLDRFPDLDPARLQDPANVAEAVWFMLTMPRESVVPEMMVLPLQETSWP